MASQRTNCEQIAARKKRDAGDEVGGGALQLLAPAQAPGADIHDVDARRCAGAHARRCQNWLAAVHAHAPIAAFLLALQPAHICARRITTHRKTRHLNPVQALCLSALRGTIEAACAGLHTSLINRAPAPAVWDPLSFPGCELVLDSPLMLQRDACAAETAEGGSVHPPSRSPLGEPAAGVPEADGAVLACAGQLAVRGIESQGIHRLAVALIGHASHQLALACA